MNEIIQVLIVEDDAPLRQTLCDMLEMHDIRVAAAANGQEALQTLQQESVQLVLSDVQMSPVNGYQLLQQVQTRGLSVPVILMTAYGSIPQAVDAMQAGAVDYLVKPFEIDDLLQLLQKHLPQPQNVSNDGPLAVDPASLQLLQLAQKVAASDATVLLSGESGSGKEVYSRYIHKHSTRRQGPFVAINCAAIPENMLEAALFGYEKGAFTGAVKAAPGKFEQAQGGTLLLDEISEMDLGLQAKLLRVIQEREVERLGSQKSIKLDVRIIATTNRELKTEVANKRFREDLYFRLSVFPLQLLPLRQRPADIVPLAEQRVAHYSRAAKRAVQLSPAAALQMQQHDWPGNVRELDNVIQRAMILMQGDAIELDDLVFDSTMTPSISVMPSADESGSEQGSRLHSDLRDRESEVILQTLERFNGSRKKTAEILGISARTLRYKLARIRDAGLAIPE